MTLHPPSLALGFIASWVLSFLLICGMCLWDWWRVRQARDEELDALLADVAVRSLEHPLNTRVN